MKKQFILFLFLLPFVTVEAKTIHKIEKPIYVGINDGTMKIISVKTTEKATILTFLYPGKGFDTFSPTSFIVDEQGQRYELIGQKGFDEDSLKQFVPKKKGKYELFFQPLPTETRIFDLIEDFYSATSTRYYGIRETGSPFTVNNPLPHNEGDISLPNMDFKVDSVQITGCIRNFILEKHKNERISVLYGDATRDMAPVDINENGYFKMKIRVDGPTWNVLQVNNSHIPIMLYPMDSIDLQFTFGNECPKEVLYYSKLQKDFSKLMRCAPMIWIKYYIPRNDNTEDYSAKFEQMTSESVQKRFDDYDAMGLYLSGKYGLNRIEPEMLRSYLSLVVATDVTALTSRYFFDLSEKESPQDNEIARNRWENSDSPYYGICFSNVRSESNTFLCAPYRNILLSRFNMNHLPPHYKQDKGYQFYKWKNILGKDIEPTKTGEFPGVWYSETSDTNKKIEDFEGQHAMHYYNWMLQLIREWRNKGEKNDTIFEQAYLLEQICCMPMAAISGMDNLYQQFTLCRNLFYHPSFVRLASELLYEQEQILYRNSEEED